MKFFRSILNNRRSKELFLVFFFIVTAGFLFFLSTEKAYALWPFTYITDKVGSAFSAVIVAVLTLVLGFVKILLQASASLFAWIVDPANSTTVMRQPIIYESWRMVRDLLNVAFILALLFSAFATIFQVEKYNYKKLLLNLILMALLVNFSFPIARVIIDASNVLMYSLINRMAFTGPGGTGGADQAIGAIAFGSQFKSILDAKNPDATFLVAQIVFGFIMAITLLAIGVMFVIRMVALAILIIFSPIAFVAAIIPSTASHSNDWWQALFKYAFFGPIMIFMLYIATSLIVQMGSMPIMQDFQRRAVDQTSSTADPGIIAAISFYSIPIVILWFGMGMAQKMGVAGAGAVMSAAKGAGKKLSGYNYGKKQYDAYKSKRDERQKEKSKGGPGAWIGDKANDISDTALGIVPHFGKKAIDRKQKRHREKNKDEIDKGAKNLVDSGTTTAALTDQVNKDIQNPAADKIETAKHAAAYLRQDSDDQKMHIQSTLESAGGVKGSNLEHIINEGGVGLTPGSAADQEYQKVLASANAIATRKPNDKIDENDVRTVSTFVREQMKKKMRAGATAESSPGKTMSYLKSKFSTAAPQPASPASSRPAESAEAKIKREAEEKSRKEEYEDTKHNR